MTKAKLFAGFHT